MKFGIVGSRTIKDRSIIPRAIEMIKESRSKFKITKIVSGGAIGVDTMAEKYADRNEIDKKIFEADWEKLGKKAGYIRNEEIVEYCDELLIIWDGKSKGTKHDIDLCKKHHKDYYLVMVKITMRRIRNE